jgi:hypothetical protein
MKVILTTKQYEFYQKIKQDILATGFHKPLHQYDPEISREAVTERAKAIAKKGALAKNGRFYFLTDAEVLHNPHYYVSTKVG